VLSADATTPNGAAILEIFNYVATAEHAFSWVQEERPITVGLLEDLQRILVAGTSSGNRGVGQIRDEQVVIGRRDTVAPDALAVHAARYVPPPPGPDLRRQVSDLVDWMAASHQDAIDPVVATAMIHYQFEAIHPFQDGNGRIGRLLVVLRLLHDRVLREPTLTVSPWFEARRTQYYDRLLEVSTDGNWDSYVRFFATGITESAEGTRAQMAALIDVRDELRTAIRTSNLRADSALRLIDHALANPSFSITDARTALGLSQPRVKALVDQLQQLGILESATQRSHGRRYRAPRVWDVLLGPSWRGHREG
jgi:Fic family protein